MAIWIKAGKAETEDFPVTKDMPTQDVLRLLQGKVGGYIEFVHLPNGSAIIVDEEGLLKQKPLNTVATALRDLNGAFAAIPLVGDAVVVSREEMQILNADEDDLGDHDDEKPVEPVQEPN